MMILRGIDKSLVQSSPGRPRPSKRSMDVHDRHGGGVLGALEHWRPQVGKPAARTVGGEGKPTVITCSLRSVN